MAKQKFNSLHEEVEDFLGYVPIRPTEDAANIVAMVSKRLETLRKQLKKEFGRSGNEQNRGIIRGIDLAIEEVNRA